MRLGAVLGATFVWLWAVFGERRRTNWPDSVTRRGLALLMAVVGIGGKLRKRGRQQ